MSGRQGESWAIDQHFDVRVDGRELFVPDRDTNGATSEFELLVGLTYRFGRARRSRASPEQARHDPR